MVEFHQADFDSLYRRYVAMVRGHTTRVLGSRALADEVTQEAFIRVLEKLRTGERIENACGLLYTIATHLCLNLLRDAKRQREILSRQGSETLGPGSMEEQIALRELLAKVPEREALVALYYYIEGMEQEEIASLLSLHRRAVGRILDRFRARANRLLGDRRAAGER